MTLYHTLDQLINIPTASVDLLITNGDLSLLWSHINRIVKPEGAIVIYGGQEYVLTQRESNPTQYRYSLSNANTMFLSGNQVPAGAVFRAMDATPNPPWIYNPQLIRWFGDPPYTLEDYIVQTYTNADSMVLDPYATQDTVAACSNRNFIGIQEDPFMYEALEWMDQLI
jgi:hypothetical protein